MEISASHDAKTHKRGIAMRLLQIFLIFLFSLRVLLSAKQESKFIEDLKRFEDRYSLKVTFGMPPFSDIAHESIECKEPSVLDVDRFLPLFFFEFNLYPPDFVKAAGLKNVVFCKKLTSNNAPAAGIADIVNDTVYFEVSQGVYDRWYVQKTIHHEFFHQVDFHDDKFVADQEWTDLNPPGIDYVSKRKFMKFPGFFVYDAVNQGFLNQYSLTGPEEDKAEFFSEMMLNYGVMEERAKKDQAVELKMQLLKDRLKKFCPSIDDAFWDKTAALYRGF